MEATMALELGKNLGLTWLLSVVLPSIVCSSIYLQTHDMVPGDLGRDKDETREKKFNVVRQSK